LVLRVDTIYRRDWSFLFTALFCWLYNRLAPFIGGIELTVVGSSEAVIQTDPETDL
jgi:hypothetical protein